MHENRLEMCVSKDATTCLMLDVVRGIIFDQASLAKERSRYCYFTYKYK